MNDLKINEDLINIIKNYLLPSIKNIKEIQNTILCQLEYEISITAMYSPSYPIMLEDFDD